MKSSRFSVGIGKAAFGGAIVLATACGIVVGCVSSPNSALATPNPPQPAAQEVFPQSLMRVLTDLVSTDIAKEPFLANKYAIFSLALANLNFTKVGHADVHELQKPADYVQTSTAKPDYFTKAFNKQTVTVTDVNRGRYDYAQAGQTWVDFAAINLGGGAFHHGFAQEETMTMEMPELANRVAQGGYFTRDKGCDVGNKKVGPLDCNPTPLLITSVHRTISLDPSLGEQNAWEKVPVSDIPSKIKPAQPPNQELNVLAVAVADLEYEQHIPFEQTAQPTIDDLFNTFVAAFTVAKDNKVDNINTGPIGTGVFQNDKRVIYVTQKLAAMQVGVNLTYYGLDGQQAPYDAVVKSIVDEYDNGQPKTVEQLLKYAQNKLYKLT